MSKVNTTTTTKTTKKTAKAKTVKIPVEVKTEKEQNLLAKAQMPIELVKDIATKSFYLGLGLSSYVLTPKNIKFDAKGNISENLTSFFSNTIQKGEKFEQSQRDWLVNFEKEQLQRIKSFLTARRQDLKRTESTIEEKIEDVISSLDIPTRNDINQLTRRINELSKELERQRSAQSKDSGRTSTKKTNAKPVAVPVAETTIVENITEEE